MKITCPVSKPVQMKRRRKSSNKTVICHGLLTVLAASENVLEASISHLFPSPVLPVFSLICFALISFSHCLLSPHPYPNSSSPFVPAHVLVQEISASAVCSWHSPASRPSSLKTSRHVSLLSLSEGADWQAVCLPVAVAVAAVSFGVILFVSYLLAGRPVKIWRLRILPG